MLSILSLIREGTTDWRRRDVGEGEAEVTMRWWSRESLCGEINGIRRVRKSSSGREIERELKRDRIVGSETSSVLMEDIAKVVMVTLMGKMGDADHSNWACFHLI